MSPRSSKDFEEIRKSRRESILNTALRLFAENGYRATSMSRIAKSADIAKGLIYNYFNSKEQLLEEVIEEGFRIIVPSLDDLKSKKQTPAQAFRQIIETVRDSVKDNPEYWQLYLRMFFQISKNERVEKIFINYTKTYFQLILELLKDLDVKDPDIELWKLGAQLDGLVLDYTLIQDMSKNSRTQSTKPEEETWPEYPLDEVIESIIQQYIN